MNTISVSIPVVVVGENKVGLASFSSLQVGDKVRFFREARGGKVDPNGRPQLRVTTFGVVGEITTTVELEGVLSYERYEELAAQVVEGDVVTLNIKAVLNMAGDELARTSASTKSWTPNALIGSIFSIGIEALAPISTPYKRSVPVRTAANVGNTTLD